MTIHKSVKIFFSDIEVWCKRYKDCNTIVAGDFNVDLDSSDKVAQFILSFINSYSLLIYLNEKQRANTGL